MSPSKNKGLSNAADDGKKTKRGFEAKLKQDAASKVGFCCTLLQYSVNKTSHSNPSTKQLNIPSTNYTVLRDYIVWYILGFCIYFLQTCTYFDNFEILLDFLMQFDKSWDSYTANIDIFLYLLQFETYSQF